MNKITEIDYIATRLTREIPDAYDKIIDLESVKSVQEAVFTSASDVFDRELSNIDVTNIDENKVNFSFANKDFSIEQDGIIREISDYNETAKAQLLPILHQALRQSLYFVEQSKNLQEEIQKDENYLDKEIDFAKTLIEESKDTTEHINTEQILEPIL